MKKLILIILLSFNLMASENGILLKGYRPVSGMDYQIELLLNRPDDHVKLLLDCQSFINGLNYLRYEDKKWVSEWFYMLSGNDCEEAAQQVFGLSSLNILFCLNINEEEYKLDLSGNIENCSE